ncbi:hypothetical protein K3G39_19720 [Pontibacter sp. HSC-14F20]|uniref:hypothetical protein n=1 Tax=Pontibacter sp. HSC-14F20 TaxID=2864136 RepID=UPI001C732438|nr:hypothetical protein [Pontibacter sp. HSC-14F20]MBX0335469.1 hypothetical protein [Pontibacter sp. HSC-14F20]
MGLQNGDVLVAFNGVNITLENAQQEIKKLSAAKPGDANNYIVLRNGNKQEIKTTVMEKEEELRHQFKLDDHATPKQLALRNSWLSNL